MMRARGFRTARVAAKNAQNEQKLLTINVSGACIKAAAFLIDRVGGARLKKVFEKPQAAQRVAAGRFMFKDRIVRSKSGIFLLRSPGEVY